MELERDGNLYGIFYYPQVLVFNSPEELGDCSSIDPERSYSVVVQGRELSDPSIVFEINCFPNNLDQNVIETSYNYLNCSDSPNRRIVLFSKEILN